MIKTNNNVTRSVCLILVIAMMLSLISCVSNEGNNVEGGDKNIYKDNRYGYIDREGNVIIEPKYAIAREFSEGLAMTDLGYIDVNSEVIIEGTHFYGSFSEGLALAGGDGKLGYVDKNGDFVIEPQWLRAFPFSEGLARVWTANTPEGKTGFIDKTGEYAIPPEMQAFEYDIREQGGFHDGRALVMILEYFERGRFDTWFGYIDKSGEIVIEPKYTLARDFSQGMAPVLIDDRWGYIDVDGNVVIDPRFDEAYPFSEGLAHVSIYGEWCYIDTGGNIVVKTRFHKVKKFSGGLAAINDSGKWGYIDKSGNIVIEPQYAEAGYFSEGLAPVRY
jgi:hypothetical protein